MNKNTILVAIIALLVGGIGAYILTTYQENYWRGGMMSQNQSDNIAEMGAHRMPDGEMMDDVNGMDHMMAMMVSSEREFIEEMIPHHQEAVDTAKEVIERGGTTPEIKRLVENIVVAQELEIADMKSWYQAWYGTPYQPSSNYTPMMRELDNLSGSTIDRVFLEDMIGHHMGAIMMARSVQPYIEHTEIAELADAVVSTQSAEIMLMRSMLQGL